MTYHHYTFSGKSDGKNTKDFSGSSGDTYDFDDSAPAGGGQYQFYLEDRQDNNTIFWNVNNVGGNNTIYFGHAKYKSGNNNTVNLTGNLSAFTGLINMGANNTINFLGKNAKTTIDCGTGFYLGKGNVLNFLQQGSNYSTDNTITDKLGGIAYRFGQGATRNKIVNSSVWMDTISFTGYGAEVTLAGKDKDSATGHFNTNVTWWDQSITDMAGGNTFTLIGGTKSDTITNNSTNVDTINFAADGNIQPNSNASVTLAGNGGFKINVTGNNHIIADTAGGNTFNIDCFSTSYISNSGDAVDTIHFGLAGPRFADHIQLVLRGNPGKFDLQNISSGGFIMDYAGGNALRIDQNAEDVIIHNLSAGYDTITFAKNYGSTVYITGLFNIVNQGQNRVFRYDSNFDRAVAGQIYTSQTSQAALIEAMASAGAPAASSITSAPDIASVGSFAPKLAVAH